MNKEEITETPKSRLVIRYIGKKCLPYFATKQEERKSTKGEKGGKEIEYLSFTIKSAQMTPSLDLSWQLGLRHSHHRMLFGDRHTRYKSGFYLLIAFFGLVLDSREMKGLIYQSQLYPNG